jgi:hypothetical protein
MTVRERRADLSDLPPDSDRADSNVDVEEIDVDDLELLEEPPSEPLSDGILGASNIPTMVRSRRDSDVESIKWPSASFPAANQHRSMSAFPLTRPTSVREFSNGAANYPSDDVRRPIPLSSYPPVRHPPRRSLLAKLLFWAIFCGAVILLAYEMSIMFQLPWLDPRRLFARVQQLAGPALHSPKVVRLLQLFHH